MQRRILLNFYTKLNQADLWWWLRSSWVFDLLMCVKAFLKYKYKYPNCFQRTNSFNVTKKSYLLPVLKHIIVAEYFKPLTNNPGKLHKNKFSLCEHYVNDTYKRLWGFTSLLSELLICWFLSLVLHLPPSGKVPNRWIFPGFEKLLCNITAQVSQLRSHCFSGWNRSQFNR